MSRRVKAAIARGFLRNEEDKKGRPLRLKLADEPPEQITVLPTRDEVLTALTIESGGKEEKVSLLKYQVRIGGKKLSDVPPDPDGQHVNGRGAANKRRFGPQARKF